DFLRQRLTGALNQDYNLGEESDAELRKQLTELARIKGRALQWLPEVAFLAVTEGAGPENRAEMQPENRPQIRNDRLYTLVHDEAHSNIASLFNQEARRLPDEDGLTVARGIVGAYPNAFYKVERAKLPEFTAAIAALGSEEDYRKFVERFGVRRTSPDFWPHSDQLHQAYRRAAPIESGLFDYNRLENR
ncbi:MAG: fatty acid cis/trans isomerase, partial [Nitrospirota bacterium]|nr:fatty acid cis/trans isomerase [Nitrospirota bacterium]